MAWTAPLTWVGNQVLTSTQMNTHLRDNLLCQAPALATTMSSFFLGTAANTLQEMKCVSARDATSSSRASSTFGDLGAGAGPSVTCITRQHAIVMIAAKMASTSDTGDCVMSWSVSGATSVAADNAWSLVSSGVFSSNDNSACSIYRTSNINAGSNTFTAKYRMGIAGTAFFDSRMICVLPL